MSAKRKQRPVRPIPTPAVQGLTECPPGSVASPQRNSPATPSTPICPRCASRFLKPIKTSTKLCKIEPSDFTIPSKTREIRLCWLAGEKTLPFGAIDGLDRPFLAPGRRNATERSRTLSNVPVESATASARTEPNRAEQPRTLRTTEHHPFPIENRGMRRAILSVGAGRSWS